MKRERTEQHRRHEVVEGVLQALERHLRSPGE